MARRALLTALVAAFAVLGCYQSHERLGDGGVPGPAASDAGGFIPRCDPRGLPGVGCTYRDPRVGLYLEEIRGTALIDEQLFDACFCAPYYCTHGHIPRQCVNSFLAGDPISLQCGEAIPAAEVGGVCFRPCDDTLSCPAGMACLDVGETLGHEYDLERACFDIAPHLDDPPGP